MDGSGTSEGKKVMMELIPCKTMADVDLAAKETLDSIMDVRSQPRPTGEDESESTGEDSTKEEVLSSGEEEEEEEVESSRRHDLDPASPGSQALDRQPLQVWNPRFHKRFVAVLAHLGLKNAIPSTIIYMMNVESITCEDVVIHLQTYVLYLKRIQGLSNEGPSSLDPLFESIPVPHRLLQESAAESKQSKGK